MDTATVLLGGGLLLLGVVLGGWLHAAWVERHERREYRRRRTAYLRAKAERLELQNEKWLNDVWADADGRLTDVAPGRLPEPAPVPLHVSEEAREALQRVNQTERFIPEVPTTPATIQALVDQGVPILGDRLVGSPVLIDTATFDPPRWPDPKEDDGDAKSGGDGSPAGAGEHEGAADRGGDDGPHGGVGKPPDEEAEDPFRVDHRVHPLGAKLERSNHRLNLVRGTEPPD